MSLSDMGLEEVPEAGFRFKEPWFDPGTKFEEEDIYLGWEKASEKVSLNEKEILKIKHALKEVNKVTTKMCVMAGLTNEDGKVEMAFNDGGEIMIVDTICTLDECRFMAGDIHVSKEGIRKYYRKTPWFKATEKAKERARFEGVADWRLFCEIEPEPLPAYLTTLFSDLYTGTANYFIGKKIFDCPDLDISIEAYKDWLMSI